MGGGGGERKLFLTVSGGADGEEEHVQEVSLHDYSQIQIVDAVTSQDDDEEETDEGEPAKKKFIFLSEQDEEGTTLYSTSSSSSSLLPSTSSKTPLILDTNVSGAVGSVIEVTNHEIIGKTEEVQTFSFETGDDEKYELIEGGHTFHSEEDEEESEGLVKPFACELCKKQFTKIEILKRHIKTHMKEKEFKCSYCTKTFDRRDVLNDHVRNHTGEKPFQCNTCHKKFTRGFVLLRHMRTHADGVYKCDYCFKSFDRKDTFRDHMRNHTGEKPFKCRFCGKAFSRSFVLTKHEKSHVIREELTGDNNLDIVDSSDTVLVEEIDYGDEDSVKQATDLLLQKELASEQVIQEHNVEQEIIQAEDEFKIIEHADIAMDDNLVCEPVVEEVVETEAITLATADGQIVRVISKEQYERLLAAAGKQKTYRCDTCNKTFTSQSVFEQHFSLRWEQGGCISSK